MVAARGGKALIMDVTKQWRGSISLCAQGTVFGKISSAAGFSLAG
jgi:hypothetical protein